MKLSKDVQAIAQVLQIFRDAGMSLEESLEQLLKMRKSLDAIENPKKSEK